MRSGWRTVATWRRAEAEHLFRRSLTLIDSVAGRNDVNVTYDLWSLGDLYLSEHRYADAVREDRQLMPLFAATRSKKDSAGMIPALESLARALRAEHETAAADSVAARIRALS